MRLIGDAIDALQVIVSKQRHLCFQNAYTSATGSGLGVAVPALCVSFQEDLDQLHWYSPVSISVKDTIVCRVVKKAERVLSLQGQVIYQEHLSEYSVSYDLVERQGPKNVGIQRAPSPPHPATFIQLRNINHDAEITETFCKFSISSGLPYRSNMLPAVCPSLPESATTSSIEDVHNPNGCPAR